MSISVTCSSCGKTLNVPETAIGKSVRCPMCKTAIQVPRAQPWPTVPQVNLPEVKRSADNVQSPRTSAGIQATAQSRANEQRGRNSNYLDVQRSESSAPAPQISVVVNQVESKADAPGVIGLIFGVLSLLCTALVCCTAGISGFVAIPFAVIGAGCSFFGRGNLRVAGIVLNFLALVPAIAVTAIFFLGLAANIVGEKAVGSAESGIQSGVEKGVVKVFDKAIDAVEESAAEAAKKDKAPPNYWIQALHGSDDRAAAEARERLTRMGTRAVPDLRQATNDKDVKLRLAVASILGDIGANAIDAGSDLAKLLKDAEPSVRAASATALGQIGNGVRDQLVPLIRATDDPNQTVRNAATDAMGKIGPPTSQEIPKVLVLWQERDAAKRAAYLRLVQSLGPDSETAIGLYLPLLKDSDRSIRSQAIRALGQIGPKAHKEVFGAALPILIGATRDESAEVRRAAVELTAQFGRKSGAVPALLERLDDDAKEVRQASMNALSSMEPGITQEELQLLRAALKGRQPDSRLFAAAQFVRLGPDTPGCLQDILAAANDPDYEVRRIVFIALARHGSNASTGESAVLATISEVINGDGRKEGAIYLLLQAAATLRKIGTPEKAVAILAAGLNSENTRLRKAVVQSLAILGSPARKLAKELCFLLAQSELESTVADALVDLGGDEIVKALCNIAESAGSTPTRNAAIQVLGRMGTDARKKAALIEAKMKAAAPPSEQDEKDAASLLNFAKQFIGSRDTDRAASNLQRVIDKYPNTKAAAEARKLLKEL
jgi:HEAT repeat protein